MLLIVMLLAYIWYYFMRLTIMLFSASRTQCLSKHGRKKANQNILLQPPLEIMSLHSFSHQNLSPKHQESEK